MAKPNFQPTDKQMLIFKAMVNGSLVEKTNGLSKCNGIHITPASLGQLIQFGFIEVKDRPGKYSVRFKLTYEAEQKLKEVFKNEI